MEQMMILNKLYKSKGLNIPKKLYEEQSIKKDQIK
jgi:hypothetical protein